MVAYQLPRPGGTIEKDLFWRNICIGADGSVIRDGSRVYAVHADVAFRLHTVDYFHGILASYPVCQTQEYKIDFGAHQLIAADRNGYVVCRLRHLQLKFRNRRAKRYEERMIKVGLLLARKIVDAARPVAKNWQIFHCPHKDVDYWWQACTGAWFYVDDPNWQRFRNPTDDNFWWWHPSSQWWFWELSGTQEQQVLSGSEVSSPQKKRQKTNLTEKCPYRRRS